MNIKEQLQDLANIHSDSITKEVAQEALEYDNPNEFFQELQQYGCISGMVTKLIYYKDTHEFYEKYYDEIEELRQEYLENGLLTKQPE
jgi:hypothetical protein